MFPSGALARRGKTSSPCNTAAAKLSSFTILEQVLRDQFEIVDVVPKARLQRDDDDAHGAPLAAIRASQDVPCDTVGNPSDPDASYNAHKGQGYVAQIVETYLRRRERQ